MAANAEQGSANHEGIKLILWQEAEDAYKNPIMAKCIYPITIGKQGIKRWKVVPCGKCTSCRRRRQAAWGFRLLHEMQGSQTSAFLTLTYDEENLTYGEEYATLVKRDLCLYLKRLRKRNAKLTNDKMVYYACGEYSPKGRPHYHMVVFNLHPSLLFDGVQAEIWENGHVRVDDCNIKTIMYTTKYVMKAGKSPLKTKEPEFAVMSKGIGKSFLTEANKKYYLENKIPYIVREEGQKQTMPRYFKEKIFPEEMRRQFGLEALAGITPENLDSSKIHEINQMNLKLKKLQDEKRSTII